MPRKVKRPEPIPAPPAGAGATDPAGSPALLETISGLAKELQSLDRQAVREYAPLVEDIIRSRSRDTDFIDHTLDGLVSFCGHEPALTLFKKLCRYYWDIDPVATAGHIQAYREYWDPDGSAISGDTPPGGPP